jgi:FlaA1/EpsC-like NDP-sugar epimerase
METITSRPIPEKIVRALQAVDRSWVPLRRQTLRTLLDGTALSLCLWAAFLIRFDWRLSAFRLEQAALIWPFVVALQFLTLHLFRVPRFSWRMFGLSEVRSAALAIGAGAAVLLGLRYGCESFLESHSAVRYLLVPGGIILIDATLALISISGLRALRRMQVEYSELTRHGGDTPQRERAIVIGAGRAGHRLVKELGHRPDLGIHPAAFVDDDPRLKGRLIHGIPVLGGTTELAEIAEARRATLALIAIASANRTAMRRIVRRCEAAGIKTKIVPPLFDVISGRVGITQIRDVAIEDLLGREPIEFTDSTAASVLDRRVVMVTGAGGSIGSELCRQILDHSPARIILVERAEGALYNIHRELLSADAGSTIVAAIADVGDAPRMRALFQKHRPHTVFHAAAHKHVPMMEDNPGEAIKNNFLGTKQLADLSDEFEVEDFVLISTDKAVNPTSVMGATKRLAELYIQDLQKSSSTRLVSVRFGNVLGSSGSVIPLFRDQIAQGGPVSVTHPDMVRYFMTIPEACRLVLEAAGLDDRGAVMVLDMGDPVRITDLAEAMIRLSGFEPGRDIEIEYVGMRPGEKLFEELALDEERVNATTSRKIFVWQFQAPPAIPMHRILERLGKIGAAPPTRVREILQEVLPEYAGGSNGLTAANRSDRKPAASFGESQPTAQPIQWRRVPDSPRPIDRSDRVEPGASSTG